MANEFKHKDPCSTLTQAEYIAACGDGHIFACQATGDIAYASSATVLSKLGKGAAGTILNMGGSCIPAWTATPTIGSTSWCNAGHAHAASNSGGTVCANVLAGTTLKSCVVTSSLTTVGALNSGSIACGFGAIDNGSSTITTTGLISGGSLDIDNVLINGTTIGHTCDTDLITVGDQSVTIAGDLAISGGCITLTGAATDVDLIDNNASALSFDASGKTGIIDIVTTDGSEGVTMSGTLGVTGVLTATGGLAGGAICIGSSTITTTGLISGGSLDIDNVLINGTTIGHTCDTDLMTVACAALTIKGTITVGVDDAGHDVKFFGAAAGAYMLYDFSCDQLEIRGASADATTSTGKLLLTTALTNVNANDVIGSINFQAPAEAGGTDAIAIAAGIRAVAQATFTCAVNNTDLIFYTGKSEAATEKFRFTADGEIGIGGANYGSDGQVLTSGGACAAAAWECAGGGVGCGPLRIADGAACAPAYSFSGDTDTGFLRPGANRIGIATGGATQFEFNCRIFMANDTANTMMSYGATLNQGGADNEILAFKSSDVAHGITGFSETDTYASMNKVGAGDGGLEIKAMSEAGQSFKLRAIATTGTSTTHTTSGTGNIQLNSDEKSGTGRGALGTDANLLVIATDCAAQFIVDNAGDIFYNGSAAAYDSYCDAQLTRVLATTMQAATCTPTQIVHNKWDDFVGYNEQTLIDLGVLGGPVIGAPPCDRGLVNLTQLQRLHNGAIWQLHSKLNDQSEEITALKGQLQALQEGK